MKRPATVLLIAFAIGLLYCLPGMSGEVIGPFRQIGQMAPWGQPASGQPWNVLQADGVLQFYGWRGMVLEAWAKGQMPFWNPYELAGTPLLGNSQSAGFYPPLVLLGLLHVPVGLAVNFLAIAHLFWAGLGAYLLCKAFGAKEGPARIAAALFGCSPFLMSWLPLSSVVYTCAWIPWALFFLARLPHSQRPLLSASGLAVSVGMLFLAGHLQFAAFGSMAMGVWWLLQLLDKRWAASALALVAIVLGVGLATPQLLPSLQYAQFSHRRNTPSEEGYEGYAKGAIQPFEFANLTGSATLGDPTEPSILEKPPVSQYWPALVKGGANYAESAVTIGPLALLMLFFVKWRDRRTWPLAAMGLLGLAIATGTYVDRVLYFYVPGWSASGMPGRAIVLFILAACLAVALGLSRDDLPEWLTGKKLEAKQLLALLGTLLPLLFLRLAPISPEMQPLVSAGLPQNIVTYWGLGAVLAYVAIVVLPKLPSPGHWHWIFWIGLFAPMFRSFGPPMPTVEGPATERIAVINDRWNMLSVPHALLPPNTAALSRIHELGGYDSLIHRDTVAMLKGVVGEKTSPPENGNMMFIGSSAKPEALAAAGVTEVWSLKPDPADPRRLTNEVVKTKLAGPRRASTPNGPATIVEEGYDHLVVKATGPGTLTLRDRNMPGWSATIGGQDVPIQGSVWREVELPAGEQTVTFRYTPPGFQTGRMAGIVSFLLLFGAILVGIGRKGLPPKPADAVS